MARDTGTKVIRFRVRRVNDANGKVMYEHDLMTQYKRINDERAKELWDWWSAQLKTGCMHGPNCFAKKTGGECPSCRMSTYHLISGAVLPVMHRLFETVGGSVVGRDGAKKRNLPGALRVSFSTPQPLAASTLVAGNSAGGGAFAVKHVTAPSTLYMDLTLTNSDEGSNDDDGDVVASWAGRGISAVPGIAIAAKARGGPLAPAAPLPPSPPPARLLAGFRLLVNVKDLFLAALI